MCQILDFAMKYSYEMTVLKRLLFGFLMYLIVTDAMQTFWNVFDVNEAQSADQRALIHMLCGRHVK